ncbi:PREDICTED: T-cell surface antigen CD2 isoform X2 [Gavialis gangeticus]|uniref:T-cell surface antigen CD2 isoform X2 n=1 Tax=Gavialis gangeticus TaxID=94835 RepID=UPI00092F475B|nr:PREDICTED: T-cell surface antigen CD2 isoform X2 [Gavialis gangeticus]
MVLKMNFKEIFLAKYLVILFFSVKGSLGKLAKVSAILSESVLLNISSPVNEKIDEVKWSKEGHMIAKLINSSIVYYANKEKYCLFGNGTLKIEQLVQQDSGNYTAEVYHSDGTQSETKNIVLSFVERVPQPLLTWDCTRKQLKLTCEVKQDPKPVSQIIHYDDKSLKLIKEWKSPNGSWNVEYQGTKNASGKYTCTVSNGLTSKSDIRYIKCTGLDLLLILCIAGGAVVFVIILVLLIYCIRRKRMEHYEEEDDDEEMPVQIFPVEDGMKQRELPPPPGRAPQRQPRQPQRPPPQSQPQAQQLAAPPRPRPRTQQRPPNRIKERT